MNIVGLLAAVGGVALIAAGGWFGRSVPVAEQWPMFEALRTTAAIIFAVVGAWMAIIYPERLKLSFRPTTKNAQEAEATPSGWGQLFTPVVHSTLILSVVLVIGLAIPLLRHAELPSNIPVSFYRGTLYAVLVALTLWQLWTVLLTLVPADRVKSSLDATDARAATLTGISALGMKRRKPVQSGNESD